MRRQKREKPADPFVAARTGPGHAEQCLIVVGMTYDGRIVEHRVMADMGLDAPWHPSNEAMQAITFAARMAALKQYRLSHQRARAPHREGA